MIIKEGSARFFIIMRVSKALAYYIAMPNGYSESVGA
jgi:hypothetical protein